MILKEKEYADVGILNRSQLKLLRDHLGYTEIIKCKSINLEDLYVKQTDQYLKDKLKYDSDTLFERYNKDNFMYQYYYDPKNLKRCSSKNILNFCHKNNIPTRKVIVNPKTWIKYNKTEGEPYIDVYLLHSKLVSPSHDLYKEIVEYFDLVSITLTDTNGKPYQKTLPYSKSEYAKLKLKYAPELMCVYNANSLRMYDFLDLSKRNIPEVKNILKKHIKPTYVQKGSYYAIRCMGTKEEVICAEDYGWTKA